MGLMFCGFFIREGLSLWQTRQWTPTPCKILSSTIQEKPDADTQFLFQVHYSYAWEGRTYTSDVFQRGDGGTNDYSKAMILKGRYSQGENKTCYVNPKTPSEAVLEHSSLLIFLLILIPIVFVVVGAGGIYFAFKDKSGVILSSQKTTLSASSQTSSYIPLCVFFIFIVLGGIFTATWTWPKFQQAKSSKQWMPTPCTVISSRVTEHSDDDGTTYGVNILYRYSIKGVELKSNQYDLMGGSSSGYKSKKKIVDRYPPGSTATCYVNPENPFEVVLERGLRSIHLVLLIPLVFLLAGISGLFFFIPKLFAETIEGEKNITGTTASIPLSSSMTLKPKFSPVTKFTGIVAFTLIWNAIAFFIAQLMWEEKETVLSVFAVIFVVVGLVAIGASVWSFLALFNPRLDVSVNSQEVRLGGMLEIKWKFKGSSDRINRLKIYLKGHEEAEYSQGTHTRTDKHVFKQIILYETTAKWDISSGECMTQIPADTMHSFEGKHNKVLWNLFFEAEIASWPDIEEEYKIEVLPLLEKTS